MVQSSEKFMEMKKLKFEKHDSKMSSFNLLIRQRKSVADVY